MSHRAAIERYYRAYRDRDRATLDALLADDFRFRSSFGAFDGRDAMLDAIWPMVGRSWATNLRIYGEAPEFLVLYENDAAPGVEHPRAHMAERIRFEGDRIAEIEVFIGPAD
jgi:ketosteroid isomerase-like protein